MREQNDRFNVAIYPLFVSLNVIFIDIYRDFTALGTNFLICFYILLY